jgi:DNA-binding transcriptional regulator YhcF (GntR family)
VHSTQKAVLPFPIHLVPGRPIYEQIVHAVKRALTTGHLQPGDRFPAIRTLSTELRINPNTAQKAVAVLVRENILEVRTGQGCFIASASRVTNRKSSLHLLEPLAENSSWRLRGRDGATTTFLSSFKTRLAK